MDHNLIPPDHLLFDGTGTQEQFIHGGPGFLWNSLVARARLEPTHSVLDIGSGNGKHARVLTEFLDPAKGRYCGFDIVPDGIKWCQDKYARYENFEFRLSDVYSDWYNKDSKVKPEDYRFPYEDNSFDVAFGASLFTHLEPLAVSNYLRETARVLKPGGRLLMTCYLINPSNEKGRTQLVQGQQFVPASDAHYVLDLNAPSRGVAFNEMFLRWRVNAAGLKVAEVTFGTWSNGIDTLGALQDALIAIKP